MFAFDFLMSLEPHFYSTMFGGFIFVGNMFMGLAFIAIAAGLIRRRGLVEDLVGPNQFWDVGKLLFGFMMVWTYLMWSQYLPIWYGNMPEETGYLIKRVVGPYRGMSFLILALCWLIPWWMILPKKAKQTPGILGIAAAMTLVGVWLERWMIVAPSQFDVAPVPAELAVFPGWVEIGTGLLFAGLFLFSYRYFLANMPILPVGDPIFQDVVEHGSHGHH
jgi:hypothetical protein